MAKMNEYGVPEGYIPGLVRDYPYARIAHLYKGNFDDPGLPMCRRGWNRDNGQSYSIWRGQEGTQGFCHICWRRAKAGKEGVEPLTRPVTQGVRG